MAMGASRSVRFPIRAEREASEPVTEGATWRRGADPFTPNRDVYGSGTVWALTALESAELDRRAVEEHGVPDGVLMESAGRAAAQVIDRLFPRGRVLAVVGSGNNGGDALVALRTLRSWGRDVARVAVGSRSPDAALLHGFEVEEVAADDMGAACAAADVLVDGVLGTGASGAPRGAAAEAVEALNGAGRPIIALDLPSGVDPTTGEVPGGAVAATATVTFGHPKLGLLLHPGRVHCGRIIAVEIGFPPLEGPARPGARVITPDWVREHLPIRAADSHKGTTGKLLLLVGRQGLAGAAVISTRGAVRGGAGYVRVASVEANRVILQTSVPDALFVDRADGDALAAAAGDCNALVAGPGIGTDRSGRAALRAALDASGPVPVLLDADALTILAEDPSALDRLTDGRPVLVTPHPGEMARLTGRPVADVVGERPAVAREFAEAHGCVVLLKGQPSLIAAPGEPMLVNAAGSSDVASAGMGDFLSGATGALLAAGLRPHDAVGAALFLASRSADLAARGPSLETGDVAEAYYHAWASPGAAEPPLGLPFIVFDQPPRW